MITVDEMAISAGKQFDPKNAPEIGTINVPLFKSKNEVNATKALVFMFCGISTRWKQETAYFLTGNSINAACFKQILINLIKKGEDTGLCVNSFTSALRLQEVEIQQTSLNIHVIGIKNYTLLPSHRI